MCVETKYIYQTFVRRDPRREITAGIVVRARELPKRRYIQWFCIMRIPHVYIFSVNLLVFGSSGATRTTFKRINIPYDFRVGGDGKIN